MADIYKLAEGTSSVDISPIQGQNDPENRGREVMINKSGIVAAYDWGGKNVYEVPFNNLSETKADQLVTWWQNLTVLTFTPDVAGAPGTTKSVIIDDIPRPIQMWGGNWDTLFAGLITLYEVSSQSFSSSSISISASRSCSPSYSESVSIGSSRSCSETTIYSTSLSWSNSLSCAALTTSSCANYFSISGSSSSDYRSCSYSTSSSCVEGSSQVGVQVPTGTVSSCSIYIISSGSQSDFSSCSVSGAG